MSSGSSRKCLTFDINVFHGGKIRIQFDENIVSFSGLKQLCSLNWLNRLVKNFLSKSLLEPYGLQTINVLLYLLMLYKGIGQKYLMPEFFSFSVIGRYLYFCCVKIYINKLSSEYLLLLYWCSTNHFSFTKTLKSGRSSMKVSQNQLESV